MKKILLLINFFLLLVGNQILAQSPKINAYEYWFNENYTAAVLVDINPVTDFMLNTDIPVHSLPVGLHTFHVRFRDDNSNWSSVASQFFYKATSSGTVNPQIIAYEYWYDEGFEARTSMNITPTEVFTLNTSLVGISSLTVGLHALHIRFKDENDVWSSVTSQFFVNLGYTATPNLITAYRYWFDMDTATITTVNLPNPENPKYLITEINAASLDTSIQHTINFQFQDLNQAWSSVITDTFQVELEEEASPSWIGIYSKDTIHNISPSMQLLESASINESFPPAVKICADGSKVTLIKFVNKNPTIPNSAISFRIQSDPLATDIDQYGKFSDYSYSGDTILVRYTHPKFVNPDFFNLYSSDNIEVVYDNNSIIYQYPIKIYRAPVVFVHGLWGNESTFEKMQNAFYDNGLYPISLLNPIHHESPLLYKIDYTWTNASSFSTNKNQVAFGILQVLRQARKEKYSAGSTIIISHSMGGVLSRLYLQDSWPGVQYKNDIIKLITLNTPHYGTQIANRILEMQSYFPFVLRKLNKVMSSPNNNADTWAISDLRVNSGAILGELNISPEAQNKVASTTIHTDAAGDYYILANFVRLFLFFNKPDILSTVFNDDNNDLIVPYASQNCHLDIYNSLQGQWHIGSAENPAIMNECITLLDENPSSSALFTNNGFPNDILSPPPPYFPFEFERNYSRGPNDSLKLINPLPGQVFNPGEDVPVNLFLAGDISRIGFIAYGNSIDPISIDTTAVPSLQFHIPLTAIGVIDILVLGGDSNNWYVFDTTHIIVNSSLIPDSITVSPKNINIPIGITKSITVTGYFSGNPVNITGVPGLSVTNNSSAINYLNSGAIQGFSVGTTDLVFSYGGLTDIAHITVFDDPEILTSAFNFPGNKVCANEVLEFSQTSIGIPTGFLWSFPGGTPTTSTLANPSIFYENPGQYSVGLTTYFTNGIDAVTLDNIIYVNPAPDANIAASGPITFCLGGNVELTSSPGNSYLWSNGETGQTITATTSGDYSVIVTDENGCSVASPSITVTAWVDNTPPIFYITDVIGNILADNDPDTPAGINHNFDNIATPANTCIREDEYYIYGLDGCDGFIQALNAVSATAETVPNTNIPGTQVSVTPDGFGFFLAEVQWSVGTSTLTVTGRDAAGNPVNLTLMKTVQDNTPPAATCADQTITFNGQPSITLNPANLVTVSDNCGIQSITLSPTSIACAQIGTVVPVTATVADVNGNITNCISQVTVTGLPCDWSQHPDGINCVDGNEISYDVPTEVFTAVSTDCYFANPFNNDEMAFAQHDLCGNGSLVAQVTSISGSTWGWAGLTMRESNAGGSKKVQLLTNLTNFCRREVRYTTNGTAYPQQFLSLNRYWLRLVRQGNQFIGYTSPNGTQWFQVMAVTVSMNACIEIGLVLTNYQQNSTVAATFANVTTTGSGGSLQMPALVSMAYVPSLNLDFSLFPNPTTGELNLDLAQYTGKAVQVELYSLHGQLLQIAEVPEVQTAIERLDLSAFQSGMYWVRVKTEGLPAVTKRVVMSGGD